MTMTDWEKQRAQDMANQRKVWKEYIATAREVAELLGGALSYREPNENGWFSHSAHIHFPELHEDFKLLLNFADAAHPGKVRIIPVIDIKQDDGESLSFSHLHDNLERPAIIGVSKTRGAQAIAREIERRILPGVPPAVAALVQMSAEQNDQHAALKIARQRLAEAVGEREDVHGVSSASSSVYRGHGDGRVFSSFDASLCSDGTEVRTLEVRYVPLEVALKIAEIFRAHAEGK